MAGAKRRERMRVLLEGWRGSGESQAAFSRRHGINPQKLSYWKRVLGFGQAKGASRSAGLRFVPVRLVGVGETAGTSSVEIVMGAECRVVVREGVSRELLREVVAVLREAC